MTLWPLRHIFNILYDICQIALYGNRSPIGSWPFERDNPQKLEPIVCVPGVLTDEKGVRATTPLHSRPHPHSRPPMEIVKGGLVCSASQTVGEGMRLNSGGSWVASGMEGRSPGIGSCPRGGRDARRDSRASGLCEGASPGLDTRLSQVLRVAATAERADFPTESESSALNDGAFSKLWPGLGQAVPTTPD